VRRACQVLYRPGRGNGELKARVPVARRHPKEAGDKPLVRRTGTAWEAAALDERAERVKVQYLHGERESGCRA
jgi:hypothetical protein